MLSHERARRLEPLALYGFVALGGYLYDVGLRPAAAAILHEVDVRARTLAPDEAVSPLTAQPHAPRHAPPSS